MVLDKGQLSFFFMWMSSLPHLLKILSHRGRLQVMCAIKDEEKNVGELQTITGLRQSALSQHLAILREKKVVKTRRDSQTIYYSSASAEIETILEFLCNLFAPEKSES